MWMSKKKQKGKETGWKPKEISIRISPIATAVICIAIGLLLVAVSLINGDQIWKEGIAKFISAVGTTLASAGMVSIFVEISTIKGIVADALKNVLRCEFPLESYSNDFLKTLTNNIAAQRLKVDEEDVEHSIYNAMEERLLKAAEGLYYDYHNSTVYIYPTEKDGVFRKKVRLDYCIMNKYANPNKIFHQFSLYKIKDNMSEQEKKNNFKVNEFFINDTNLLDECEKYKRIDNIPNNENSTYQYNVCFERALQACKKHRVKLEFEYNVPITDLTQVFKITLPCKRLKHTLIMEDEVGGSKWGLQASAFTSFFCSSDDKDSGFEVEHKNDKVTTINFDNWIIPGAGYVAYFSKK